MQGISVCAQPRPFSGSNCPFERASAALVHTLHQQLQNIIGSGGRHLPHTHRASRLGLLRGLMLFRRFRNRTECWFGFHGVRNVCDM